MNSRIVVTFAALVGLATLALAQLAPLAPPTDSGTAPAPADDSKAKPAPPSESEFPLAPEWAVSEWLNADPGTLADQHGKVVLIHFFQLWCPSCNQFTQPLFEKWEQDFAERDDLRIVSIHTVFEGHDEQAPAKLREWVREKKIEHPVGIDAFGEEGDDVPITMERFETGGTPHVVFVDRRGRLRWSQFGSFDPDAAEEQIETLLAEEPPKEPSPKRAKDAPLDLDGRYEVFLKQYTKNCGRARGGLSFKRVYVKSTGDRVAVTFPVPYLDRTRLELPFDKRRAEIRHRAEERIDIDGNPVTLTFELDGWLVRTDPPRIEYEFTLERVGEAPGSDCKITGGGWAERTHAAAAR